MKTIVTVIGAGNGGTAIAGYLSSMGATVNLCDLFPQYLEGIQNAGGIDLTLNGQTSHQVLNMITDNVAHAIQGAHLVMVATPSFTHKMIAEACYDALEDNQVVVLNPGRTGGALEFLNVVRSKGCKADITVAETQTLIYSCRKTGPSAVEIYGVKKEVMLGAFPANCTQKVLDLLHPFYPQFTPAKNCLETSLSNIGALFHPTPVLLNIGRIEKDPKGFRYYWDGISPSVATLIKEIDCERMAVADAYNIKILSSEEWLSQSYDTHGDDLYQLIQNNQAYGDIMAPNTIQARYVTEDVPMSLVPISELGRIASVPTPNIDAVIKLTSSIYKRDFRAEGRSVKNMGLEGMTKEQVAHFFETGIR
ncbi:NAD/NADP octopine/nopaline dehydrogenase family protein [Oscillospiraceae bacterium LTW-04]|nr:NAD/NADP octopine/nopaline dehydrogenase family protein [Oscillospiraceae bacterium MB24-C1]